MAFNTDKTVLITGTTGFIGFRVLQFALEAGWKVRAAVRSQEKADSISNHPLIKSLKPSPEKLSFTIVKDVTKPGAFNEAVQGVSYIIHIASPTPMGKPDDPISAEDAEAKMIGPAVQGTLSMLEAAKTQKSVKRVIITSSVVAILPPAQWGGKETPGPGTVYTPQSRMKKPEPPYPHVRFAYCVSKIASLNAGEAWVKKESPHFSVVHIHPGYVLGRNGLATTADMAKKGTNIMVLSVAFGSKTEELRAGGVVHLDDVARVHVDALDEAKVKVSGARSFLMSVPAVWDEVPKVIKKDYQHAMEKKVIKDDGSQPTSPINFDVTDTEQTFGLRFKNFEEQARSVLDQYVELATAQ